MRDLPTISHGEYLRLVEALATYTAALSGAAVAGPEEDRAAYRQDAAEAMRLFSRLVPDPAMRTRLSQVVQVTLEAAQT